MIAHTQAFATYRSLSQAHIDFAVLVCTAVPALRPELANVSTPLMNIPDHFKAKPDSKAQLIKYASAYQSELGRTNLITVFSYFESYVKGALQEIVEFHGKEATFKALAHQRASTFVQNLPPAMEASKRKLQEPAKPAKKQKYVKHSQELDKAGFRFPTELLAYYGAITLIAKSKDKTGMRAWEVPNILEDGLLFPLSAAERKLFEDCRDLRNKIAHGKAPNVTLKQSLNFASALHALASKIDGHIVQHFFILQKYIQTSAVLSS